MTISILNLVILILLLFFIGYLVGDFYGKTFMNDMFCIFLRIHQDKEKQELLKKYKEFLTVVINDTKILKEMEKDLQKEGK